MPTQYLRIVNDKHNGHIDIAYRYFTPSDDESNDSREKTFTPVPIVIFLNGLLSNMSGTKSRSLQKYANDKGAGFLCFDYRGHGNSSGNFVDCTMHDWMEDARNMLDYAMSLSKRNLTSFARNNEHVREDHEHESMRPKVILVGSSVGAWIALRLAMERPNLVTCVIGIGSAIDFTHTTYQKLTVKQQKILSSENQVVTISSPYLDEPFPFSSAFYESGNHYLLCHDPPSRSADFVINRQFKLSCPVRFLHGLEDDVAHWSTITNAVEILRLKYYGEDIAAKLLDGGDHRLSRMEDISVLMETLDEFL